MQIAGLGTRGTRTCGTGTAGLGHALQGQFVCVFFVIRMLKEKIFLCDCMYVIIVVTNTTVESLR